MRTRMQDRTILAVCLCAGMLILCFFALAHYLQPARQGFEPLETVGGAFGMVLIDIADEETADSYHVEECGVYVLAVQEESQADQAGISSGDRLVSVNASPVQTAGEFVALQEGFAAAQEIRLDLQRGSDAQRYAVTLIWNAE